MKLLEYESKEMLARMGLKVPRSGGVIKGPGQVSAALKRAGKAPWAVKAQVLAGGRGKAGGIKLCKTPKDAQEAVKAMLGKGLATHQTQGVALKVSEILIEGGVDIQREFYLSVVVDRQAGGPSLIASAQGGVEIERLAKEEPEAILREPFSPQGLLDFQARRLAFGLKLPADRVPEFCRVVKALSRLFLEMDCSMVEVNPLALTPEGFVALDAKVVTDDNALFRHPDLAQREDLESSPLELEAKKSDLSYIGLDGDIGCMVNGAGLAMGTMDTIKLAGGSPANFLDVGGGADEGRVTKALGIILQDKRVKAVLVNIFGGIVKCDMIAKGILGAIKKARLKLPLIVRLEGTNVEEGRRILEESGVPLILAGDLWSAAQKAVASARTIPDSSKEGTSPLGRGGR